MKAVLALAVCLLLPLSAAHASTIAYFANLLGSNEVPPTGSPATGFTLVTVDTTANTMHVQVTFSGLEAGDTASHIHCCGPLGTNQIVATTTPTFPNFPSGVTSGTYDNTLDMTQASSYNPAFITAQGGTVASAEAALFAGLAGGMAYLNIHSSMFPGGEIRGQLAAATPEPGTLLLAGVALAGFALRRRRFSW
ncbi:MAG TPA: CHRD domain-containing protein [Candidatus Acidoferrales bacterium]|nr:CHRD domain-containing protein [Candidatus Acidoferrales bacterium]